MSIDCGPNYAGFCMKCILQEAGSVEGREQSLEMCDLYSAAPNTFVLLRSCISFASLSFSLSFFPFPLMLSLSLRPLSWCFSISLNQHLSVLLCHSFVPPFGIFPCSSVFLFLPFSSFYSCLTLTAYSACVGLRLYSSTSVKSH